MLNKVQDLSTYDFQAGEKILLDANIWLYLYPAPTQPAPGISAPYTTAFKKMLAAKAEIILDALILSEYINRYCRIEWSAHYKEKYEQFKDFRKSSDIRAVGTDVACFVRAMLKQSKRCHHPFDVADIGQVVDSLEAGQLDFNDGLIVETCKLNGWKLVTHDQDFKEGGIEVLTTNIKLRAACS